MAEWKELQFKSEKYTDAEAVAAVLADDAYVKNNGDTMSGNLDINKNFPYLYLNQIASDSPQAAGVFYFKRARTGGLQTSDYFGFERYYGYASDNNYHYGAYLLARASGNAGATFVPTYLTYGIMQADGNHWFLDIGNAKHFDLNNGIIKDQKNHVHSALSGTKKLVEIDIGGTPYYFEVFPTKV